MIRLAQPSDKNAVLDFCRHTWEDQEDYIDSVWDRWLADPHGVMVVATHSDIPIAVGRGLMLSDRESWLEGIRVDRRYRRQGIFRQLETELYKHLRQRGAHICRTCIASNNEVMTAIARRSHFQEVNAYSIYTAPSIPEPTHSLHHPTQVDLAILRKRLGLPLYVCRGAKWQALTDAQLTLLQNTNRLWSFQPEKTVGGLFVQSEMENPDGSLWVGLCNVWQEEAEFYTELRRLSDRLGFQQVSGFFTVDRSRHEQLSTAGYRNVISYRYIVYERVL